jgi:hypothetical protein
MKTQISGKPRFRSKGCGSESNVLLASNSFFKREGLQSA